MTNSIGPSIAARLARGVEAAYDAIEGKGGTLPTNKNLDSLAETITSLPTGLTNYGTVELTDGRVLTIQSLEEFSS